MSSERSELHNLTQDPELIAPGIKAWKNINGYASVLLHFSADPEGRQEEERRIGTAENDYRREHDLDFTSYAGLPVYGAVYHPTIHEDTSLRFIKEIPVWRSWDFGYRRPAMVLSQVLGDGAWHILGELMGENQTLNRFVEDSCLPYLLENFEGAQFIDTADPAGRQVTDKSEHTSLTILAQYGIFPLTKRSEFSEGHTLIVNKLIATAQKKPGYRINPRTCPIIVDGMRGAYRYPKPTDAVPEPKLPMKDGYYEHLMDAQRYSAVHAFQLWKPQEKEVHVPSREERLLAKKRKPQFDEFGLEL